MKLLFALLLSVLLSTPLALAFDCPGQNAALRPIGFDTITVSSTAVGLNAPRGTEYAEISLESNAIRKRDDGTDPTSSVGILLPAGTLFGVCQNSLSKIRFIRQTADGLLNVSYYGR